jgi:deoxyribose-phosphate aldolase
MSKIAIASFIDHTLLQPNVSESDIANHCRQAIRHQFASVCIHSTHLEMGAKILADSSVRLGTVIDFPFGQASINTKIFQAKDAIYNLADDLDVVADMSLVKSGKYSKLCDQLSRFVTETRALYRRARDKDGLIVKVIIEAGLLSQEEIIAVSRLVVKSGANFVKTSSGYLGAGASPETVKLIRQVVGEKFGVKASGSIRSFNQAIALIESGANRIGTSSALKIVSEAKNTYFRNGADF